MSSSIPEGRGRAFPQIIPVFRSYRAQFSCIRSITLRQRKQLPTHYHYHGYLFPTEIERSAARCRHPFNVCRDALRVPG